jgi:hypothetical protein
LKATFFGVRLDRMILELHDHLKNPLVVKATRVLICTDDGTPVAFSLEFQPGHIRHFRASDADFEQQLRWHGIDRTVVVSKIAAQKSEQKGGIILG